MKRTIEFGKVAYDNPSRKTNMVDIEMRFEEKPSGEYRFSVCGDIWNHLHTDIKCGGQCLDTIAEYVRAPLFKKIYRLWKLYHLNDAHAGTVEQDAAIEAWKANGNKYDYTAACNYLKSIGLYEVPHPVTGEPYKYGHSLLWREIPENDLKEIRAIMGV